MMSPNSISLRHEHWIKMVCQVREAYPREACGVLAGEGDVVKWVQPITNVEDSRNRFRMDPQEQLDVLLRIEDEGLQLTAIYHSHPHGPSDLSVSDVEGAAYLEAAYLVWSPAAQEWSCKAFIIEHNAVREIPIHIAPKGTLSG